MLTISPFIYRLLIVAFADFLEDKSGIKLFTYDGKYIVLYNKTFKSLSYNDLKVVPY